MDNSWAAKQEKQKVFVLEKVRGPSCPSPSGSEQHDVLQSPGLALAPRVSRACKIDFFLFSIDGVFARKCHFQEPKLSADSSQV